MTANTRYVVVTRIGLLSVKRFMTIEAAANYIVYEAAFGRWKVLAQEASSITASTPYRELRQHEKLTVEKKLYPTLFE